MVLEKLFKIQQKLKSPKSEYNEFGKFAYRSAENIEAAVKPLLAENGCLLTLSDEMVYVGTRHYVKATAKITEVETGESYETSAWAREEETKKGMDASQITGSASSYARKYALAGLFILDNTKDADSMDNRDIGDEPIDKLKVQVINDTCRQRGIPLDGLCKLYKVQTVEQITENMFRNIIGHWDDIKRRLVG